MTKLWYIASPFSLYPGGMKNAYHFACEQTALLIKAGVPVFSPIAHSFGIAVYGAIDPLDHSLWMLCDAPLMEVCSGLIMLQGTGWALSEGMRIEREAFQAAGKPIVWMTPGTVPPELLKK